MSKRATTMTLAGAADLLKRGMVEAARDGLQHLCRHEPRNAEAAHLLGLALFRCGQIDASIAELDRAVQLRPASGAFHNSLGNVLLVRGDFDRAATVLRRAVELDARLGESWVGLSLALAKLNDITAAIAAGRESLKLLPNAFQPYANLSSSLRTAGEVEEGIAILEQARQRFPGSVEILDLLLAARNYSSRSTPEQCINEARQFGTLVGPPEAVQWPNVRDAQRRLRIGYLSADLRSHSVSYFLEPILANHDRSAFEVHVYSLSPRSDKTTERLRSSAAVWRNVERLNSRGLIAQLREDRLDVLIELGGHTTGNRLGALAKGAAPVQVTYLGYPNTTGVPAIGYRIVDALTDPPQEGAGAEQYATEQLVRLPGCFLCYGPNVDAPLPEVQPPCERAGYVTFGCFNSLPKIDSTVLDCWATLLQRVGNSRLLLKNKSFADAGVCERWRRILADRGIETSRVEMIGRTPTSLEHLAMYSRVDVALDTFPYNGTTTTCESLWMGVAVVSLEGRTHPGRVGVSLLNAVGLTELIAPTAERYVEIAAELASNAQRLRELRSTLRDRMAKSPLCDARSFVLSFESALRKAWTAWCASG